MEKKSATTPLHEREYWETWVEQLPVQAGTIFDARSYDKWWKEQKALRRMENTNIATTRVNGKFLKGGEKR